LSSAAKKSFLLVSNYDETKSKEEKNKKNGSKKKTHHWQSVQYRSWWKQGIIKMAVSEDHASCWVHKDLTVTTKQIQALLTAARASGGKDKCQVRLTGIEQEYWMGTDISRLGGYGFRGIVTAGDESEANQKGVKMGAGYVNLWKKWKWQQRKVGRETTFLVKVKAHRGEPANEEANIQADKAISGKDIPTEWHDRTNRAVFTWQELQEGHDGFSVIHLSP